MRLKNMLKICLVFSKSEPQYACKRYVYKKTCIYRSSRLVISLEDNYHEKHSYRIKNVFINIFSQISPTQWMI